MPHIAPSILAADMSRLGEQVRQTEQAGAHRIQVDVMDGHFVPNLSMGPAVVKSLRPVTRMPLEVHLMVERPERFVEAFVKAGADSLIFHYEAVSDPRGLAGRVRGLGKQVGVAVNPGTPVDVLEPLLAEIDLALCMTVHPGFGGQAFLPESAERIGRLRDLIERVNPRCELEVDGGITEETAAVSLRAGANVFVIGTSIFGHAEGPGRAVQHFQALLANA